MATTAGGQRDFRDALGRFPSGVTVVTAHTRHGRVGMTVQSFMALSLEPALVLLAVARTSTTWPAVAAAGGFAVNILAEQQSSVARQFARSGTDKFEGVPLLGHSSPSRHPLLAGTLAWFDCDIAEVHDGGDHVIVVCAVKDFALRDDGLDAAGPLVFYRSNFPVLAAAPATA